MISVLGLDASPMPPFAPKGAVLALKCNAWEEDKKLCPHSANFPPFDPGQEFWDRELPTGTGYFVLADGENFWMTEMAFEQIFVTQ